MIARAALTLGLTAVAVAAQAAPAVDPERAAETRSAFWDDVTDPGARAQREQIADAIRALRLTSADLAAVERALAQYGQEVAPCDVEALNRRGLLSQMRASRDQGDTIVRENLAGRFRFVSDNPTDAMGNPTEAARIGEEGWKWIAVAVDFVTGPGPLPQTKKERARSLPKAPPAGSPPNAPTPARRCAGWPSAARCSASASMCCSFIQIMRRTWRASRSSSSWKNDTSEAESKAIIDTPARNAERTCSGSFCSLDKAGNMTLTMTPATCSAAARPPRPTGPAGGASSTPWRPTRRPAARRTARCR